MTLTTPSDFTGVATRFPFGDNAFTRLDNTSRAVCRDEDRPVARLVDDSLYGDSRSKRMLAGGDEQGASTRPAGAARRPTRMSGRCRAERSPPGRADVPFVAPSPARITGPPLRDTPSLASRRCLLRATTAPHAGRLTASTRRLLSRTPQKLRLPPVCDNSGVGLPHRRPMSTVTGTCSWNRSWSPTASRSWRSKVWRSWS